MDFYIGIDIQFLSSDTNSNTRARSVFLFVAVSVCIFLILAHLFILRSSASTKYPCAKEVCLAFVKG